MPVAEDDLQTAIVERLDDLARALRRQSAGIDRLAEDARARQAKDVAGADISLLVDLYAVHSDATACAATSRSNRERAGFEALAAALERLIAGRGGEIVVPAPGTDFDPATMDAAEVRPAPSAAEDRLVAALLTPGLRVTTTGRTVRAARVAVYRHRA